MQEIELLENRELRDKLVSKLEVLEKVKQLVLLPGTDYATVEQVAEYYEVPKKAINSLIFDHKDELHEDGFKVFTRNEVLKLLKGDLEISKGKTNVIVAGNVFTVPNRGLSLFSRRAILRVGMLLRDSEVAKRIRSYLLDVEEAAPTEAKLNTITEEERLLLNAIRAKTKDELIIALHEYHSYTSKRINILQDKVEVLVDGILKWDVRSVLNKIVRRIAYFKLNGNLSKAWHLVNTEMLYKHHIDVKKRKNAKDGYVTIFDVLTKDELPLLVKTCVALAESYKIDISDILLKHKIYQ